jgi:hypothetical protein
MATFTIFSTQIIIPVCEPLNPKSEPVIHHYWVLNVNIRDRSFQVLDSWRSTKDKVLKATYHKICTTLPSLWDCHYKSSKVQLDEFKIQEIKVPKQDNK